MSAALPALPARAIAAMPAPDQLEAARLAAALVAEVEEHAAAWPDALADAAYAAALTLLLARVAASDPGVARRISQRAHLTALAMTADPQEYADDADPRRS